MRGKLKDRRKLCQSANDSCSPTEEQKVKKASDPPVYIMNVYTAKEKQSQHTHDRASQHINSTLFRKYIFTNKYLYYSPSLYSKWWVVSSYVCIKWMALVKSSLHLGPHICLKILSHTFVICCMHLYFLRV